jgi:hypothetical protein
MVQKGKHIQNKKKKEEPRNNKKVKTEEKIRNNCT